MSWRRYPSSRVLFQKGRRGEVLIGAFRCRRLGGAASLSLAPSREGAVADWPDGPAMKAAESDLPLVRPILPASPRNEHTE